LASVLIGVTTYGRNDELSGLLVHLDDQAQRLQQEGRRSAVLIVDNNPGGDAEPVVASAGLPLIHYSHEPRPGIAAGRNRALAWARDGGYDAVAFLDDDETPAPGWLAALVAAAEDWGAAGVTGPVVRDYPHEPTGYVSGMRRWDSAHHRTGTAMPAASSANLLLDLHFLAAHGLQFDEEFGLSGGSDTLITKRLLAAGGRLVWAQDAVVVDHVTEERLTPQWLRKRAHRVGNTHSRVSLVLAGSGGRRLRARVLLAAKGAALVVVGSTTAAAGSIGGDAGRAGQGSWRSNRGKGMLAGAFGKVAYDYQRPSLAPGPAQGG
jgi:glycosyltransferase involved in cell wall biosynthesis